MAAVWLFAQIRAKSNSGIFPPAQYASLPAAMKIEDQLRDELRRRHYSYATEEAYVGWYRRYVRFHQLRHPGAYSEKELGAFLSHLGRNLGLSRATQRQALNALVFLHKSILGHELHDITMWRPKEKHPCPMS
jgi:hypothetical protein